MLTIICFFICTLSFSLITWMMIKAIYNSQYPPNNDDDGGLPDGNDFPLIDLPPGGSIEDLFVDRWPEETPPKKIEKLM